MLMYIFHCSGRLSSLGLSNIISLGLGHIQLTIGRTEDQMAKRSALIVVQQCSHVWTKAMATWPCWQL